MKKLGMKRFDVDAANDDPTTTMTPHRPGRSEAMQSTHAAATYNKWFRAQVQKAIDDPRPSIPHADVVSEFAERRAVLCKQISANQSAVYKEWFRQQVQESIDDPRPDVPHEEVMTKVQAVIDEARKNRMR